MFRNGNEVPRDEKQSRFFYEKACQYEKKQDYPVRSIILFSPCQIAGIMTEMGIGGGKRPTLAKEYYKKDCQHAPQIQNTNTDSKIENPSCRAYNNLISAPYYREAEGAYEIYKKFCLKGHEEACDDAIATLKKRKSPNHSLIKDFYEIGCQYASSDNHRGAYCYQLAEMLFTGKGGKRDVKAAYRLFTVTCIRRNNCLEECSRRKSSPNQLTISCDCSGNPAEACKRYKSLSEYMNPQQPLPESKTE